MLPCSRVQLALLLFEANFCVLYPPENTVTDQILFEFVSIEPNKLSMYDLSVTALLASKRIAFACTLTRSVPKRTEKLPKTVPVWIAHLKEKSCQKRVRR